MSSPFDRMPIDIQNAISEGIACPICGRGRVGVVERIGSPGILMEILELACSKCLKRLRINYRVEPFEIINVEEAK